VARFTFTTGNLKKVLGLPLYGLGALASLVVPRREELWVFGSGSGVGEGALALIRYTQERGGGLRTVWLTRNSRDAADAERLGITTASARSPKGFWLTLRARVIVVTHGFGDANRFGTRGGFVVQVWHGIPFKHIHLDSPETLRIPLLSRFGTVQRMIRRAYLRSARGIQLFATASPLAASRIRTAFGLPSDRIVVTGDPRDDVLATETRADARAKVAALLGEPDALAPHIILYAPTWRDGQDDPLVPNAGDWDQIAAYLESSDSVLLVRSHPLGVGDYTAGLALSPRIRLLGSNLQGDITPLLPAVDTLITDFSSIAFDFSLVGGTMIFLAPDVLTYSSSRGSYEPFSDFSGGNEVVDWAGAVRLLGARDSDPGTAARLTEHTRWLADRVFSFRDGRNTARLYDEILARTAQGPPPTYTVPPRPLTVDAVELSEGPAPVLTLSGSSVHRPPKTVQLAGPRLNLPGDLTTNGATWTARIPLLASRLGGPLLPPPSGRYRVRLNDDAGRILDTDISAPRPAPGLRPALFRYSAELSDAGISIDISPPLGANEVGAANQARLATNYRRVRRATQNSIFFESYYGRNVSSNPRGIDRALAPLLPDVTRYWSIVDASVEVPDGGIALIEHSEAWWSARASSRVLIVNDWLRGRFRKRAGQTVVQTWHGTPLKQLALDRPGVRLRAALATRREKAHWDVMLAQNPFSADVFRSAYAFRGPIWQEGYPRNDVLRTGDASAVRLRLGIPHQATVVLYAPTWRDDRPGKVDHLDVAQFSQNLGPGFVTLIRGHSRTLQPGAEIVADGVLDVTSYPDISELFLVADALITDYSSVMFDFSVTGKPLYFFTPDLEHYRDELRGFYFDLLASAPGPVVTDPEELVRLVKAADASDFAERYAAWQERFNPKDDGAAGERVVRRLIDEGLLDGM
jgi:CDP-glycerol glycerophosphotransferase